MNILLINPGFRIWNTPTQIPLGLAYLGSTLVKNGYNVRALDLIAEDGSELNKVLDEFKPDIVGITATTPQIKSAWDVAKQIKEKNPDVVVILGGAHPTALPEESAGMPFIDGVARGEGEETLLDICRNLDSGKNRQSQIAILVPGTKMAIWGNICGLSYRNEKGAVTHNPPRPLIKDIDSIPFPAFDLFKMNLYSTTQPLRDRKTKTTKSFYITTSRGCPYNCVYCFKGVYGQSWRPRSPENVIEEWEFLVKKLGATEIGVQDDVFNLNIERAKKICNLIIEKKLNHIPWIINNGMRLDFVDDELLKLMKKSGCRRVAFGVENGDINIRKIIGKPFTDEQIMRAYRLSKKNGLRTSAFFMIGNPGENEKTIDSTIKFAVRINSEIAHFTITTPLPGSRLYDIVKKDGVFLSNDWDDYGMLEGRALFSMGELTPELMVRKWHEAYRRFYLRPSRVIREIFNINNWLNLPKLFKAGMRYFFR